MAVLYGWQRKLAMLPLNLFVLGWVVYSIGFVWVLVQWSDEYSSKYAYGGSRHSPLLYPFFVILVGGPFVYLLGVAQAILPGIASSIVGIPTAFVSTIFLVSAGAIAYDGGAYINKIVTDHVSADTKKVLMFIGAMFVSICWCFVMMLSTSYKSKPKQRNHYELFDQTNRSPSQKCRAPFTPGVARGLSIPFTILCGVGWCVYMVGTDRWNSDHLLIEDLDPPLLRLSMYGTMVVGPLLLLAALLHAGCSGGASTVMGVFTSILSTVYVVLMGFMVTHFGEAFYTICQVEVDGHKLLNCSFLHSSLDINLIYIFAGGVGSLFFWTFVLALWPFYRHRPQHGQDSNVINYSSSPQYGSMRLEESFSNSDTYGSQPLTRENGKH